jgi:hypothetical protein
MSRDWTDNAACTLPTADRPLRAAAFDTLFAETLTEVTRSGPTRARMVLRGGPGTESRTRELAAQETQCCSFFTFDVRRLERPDDERAETVVLDIEVPALHEDVLTGLLDRASAVASAEATGADTQGRI